VSASAVLELGGKLEVSDGAYFYCEYYYVKPGVKVIALENLMQTKANVNPPSAKNNLSTAM
jgi:hypothetical protein